MKQGIAALIAPESRSMVHVCDTRDFRGQLFVPNFPAEPRRKALRDVGFDAFLIGESLMLSPDPAAALGTFLGRPALPV